MKQVIQHGAIIISIVLLHTVLASDKQSVKIVNSTNISELKPTVPKEDKTRAVAYVYAVESTEFSSSSESPTSSNTKDSASKRLQHEEEAPSISEKPPNKRECVTRVIEKMKGDERTVYYNATEEEAKQAGKKIIDTVCKGDVEFELISHVSLASLEDDIYHLP